MNDDIIISNNQYNKIRYYIIDKIKDKLLKHNNNINNNYKLLNNIHETFKKLLQVINCKDGSSLLIFNNKYVIIREDNREYARILFMTELLYDNHNNYYKEDDYRNMNNITKITSKKDIINIIYNTLQKLIKYNHD